MNPNDQSEFRRDYTEARWGQLHAFEKESSEAGYTFLFHVNAGGAAAVLAFIGTSAALAANETIYKALACFVAGLICCGIFRACHYCWASRMFDNWRRHYNEYAESREDWETLLAADDLVSKPTSALYLFVTLSGIAFVAGCSFGIFAFFSTLVSHCC